MDIWYESAGAGPPLVFLHAAAGDSRMWDNQWEVFAATNFVVRCDFQGFGRTGLEAGEICHAADVLWMLDRLGIDSAVLVGASMGGRVATELAVAAPERVAGLVLVGSVLGDHDFSQGVRDYWEAEDAAMEAGDIDAVVELNLAFWVDGPRRYRADLTDEARAEVADMLRVAAEHQLPHLETSVQRSLADDVPARIGDISVPTLVVVGDQDATDIIEIADRLAASIPGAEKVTIPDTAHLLPFEAPDAFNAALADFLGGAAVVARRTGAAVGSGRQPDEFFANPRLAAIYDDVDGERDDLDLYRALVTELGATSILDVGCGTGALACSLSAAGLDVVGVDPALASLDVARSKPGAELVRWVHGTAATLPPLAVDVATMTGNVAQVFVADDEWLATLAGIRRSLGSSGHLVFETRDPAMRAWERWTPERTRRTVATAGGGRVETWHEVTDVSLPLVSFTTTFRFLDAGDVLTSDSTLRFRPEDEVRSALTASGFAVREIRDTPDRPGNELVFIAAAVDG